MPRRTHHRKKHAESEEFKRTLARRLLSLKLPKETPVRVWFIDEHHYGIIGDNVVHTQVNAFTKKQNVRFLT